MTANVPNEAISTLHMFHGGMYSRSIHLPPGMVLIGCLVKIPTLLVVQGEADILSGEGWVKVNGYSVLPGAAGRKQVFITHTNLQITMIFPTRANTVEEAEREMTDEYTKLLSRQSTNDTVITTGE